MIRWARDQGATTIVVPDELDEPGNLERLAAGVDPAGEVAAASSMRVIVVPMQEADR